MYINLDEGCNASAEEAMDLPGLDDKNVTGAGFKFLSVNGPEAAAFPDELDFIVRMTMGPGTTPRKGAEERLSAASATGPLSPIRCMPGINGVAPTRHLDP